jgi:hypothetical protein
LLLLPRTKAAATKAAAKAAAKAGCWLGTKATKAASLLRARSEAASAKSTESTAAAPKPAGWLRRGVETRGLSWCAEAHGRGRRAETSALR